MRVILIIKNITLNNGIKMAILKFDLYPLKSYCLLTGCNIGN